MKTIEKRILLKINFAVLIFLFACNNSSHPPTLKIIQADHTSIVTTENTISESIEKKCMEEKSDSEEGKTNSIKNDYMKAKKTSEKRFFYSCTFFSYSYSHHQYIVNLFMVAFPFIIRFCHDFFLFAHR